MDPDKARYSVNSTVIKGTCQFLCQNINYAFDVVLCRYITTDSDVEFKLRRCALQSYKPRKSMLLL